VTADILKVYNLHVTTVGSICMGTNIAVVVGGGDL